MDTNWQIIDKLLIYVLDHFKVEKTVKPTLTFLAVGDDLGDLGVVGVLESLLVVLAQLLSLPAQEPLDGFGDGALGGGARHVGRFRQSERLEDLPLELLAFKVLKGAPRCVLTVRAVGAVVVLVRRLDQTEQLRDPGHPAVYEGAVHVTGRLPVAPGMRVAVVVVVVVARGRPVPEGRPVPAGGRVGPGGYLGDRWGGLVAGGEGLGFPWGAQDDEHQQQPV